MSNSQARVKRKLIEVALPLEAINRESAREKSIRHGHPSTLHLWWARRPLAACRAVLFAQLVDDPSSHPDRFPTEEDQARERRRLFDLIERLVKWENSNDEALFRQAYEEIVKCFDGKPPAILDPFAGGGSIPLEAQRLGLEAHASDLNPVAVLINKALIEIPPKWSGRPPVFPGAAEQRMHWPHATGLAEDVRRYGQWMRDEAEKRIGHLYPKAKLPDGSEASVIAWIWARTVTCPNPACGIQMPLVRSWWLGKKKGKEAYVLPRITDGGIQFSISHDPKAAPTKDSDGTVNRRGASCIACGTAVSLAYIRDEGQAKRMGVQLMAIVAEGNRQRLYLPPSPEHEQAAQVPTPEDAPDAELSTHPQYMGAPRYGMTRHADLYSARQLVAIMTFSDLVREVRDLIRKHAVAANVTRNSPADTSTTDASAYADAVATYLGLAVSRYANFMNQLCQWRPDAGKEQVGHLFARQAIPMLWDWAESNPWSSAAGSWDQNILFIPKVLDRLMPRRAGAAVQADAVERSYDSILVSTDPPYYDNVPYSDLSDFFYVWLRRSLLDIYPSILGTMLTPKAGELVADRYRLGGKDMADRFFEEGFVRVFDKARRGTPAHAPITVFYAFKQTETDVAGTVSTGWEVLLEGMIRSGWEITATWPIRTELGNRIRSLDSNALASSVVLACRPRSEGAGLIGRRAFLAALKRELPGALRGLQQGSIAPVDLAQAAIGPGMAIFSRYSQVIEPDGSNMTVRTALGLINQVLDEVLAEQEGDFDSDTRFCIKWFSQFGWDEQPYGRADELSRAVGTSADGLVRGGIFWARAGKARLLEPSELTDGWDPATDERISVWEVVLRLAKALNEKGAEEAARLMAQAGQRIDLDTAKELAYLLFSICEKRGWTQTALLFNGLGTSWSDLSAAARTGGSLTPPPAQGEFDFGSDDEE